MIYNACIVSVFLTLFFYPFFFRGGGRGVCFCVCIMHEYVLYIRLYCKLSFISSWGFRLFDICFNDRCGVKKKLHHYRWEILKTLWELLFIEGGSLYLVNCTTERELCAAHNIRGYPYITAFRGQGWLGHSHCVSPNSDHLPYTRTNYHGVIQVTLESVKLIFTGLTDPTECWSMHE